MPSSPWRSEGGCQPESGHRWGIAFVYWIEIYPWWGTAVEYVSCSWMSCDCGRVFVDESLRYVSAVMLSSTCATRFKHLPVTQGFGCCVATWFPVVWCLHQSSELAQCIFGTVISLFLISLQSQFVFSTIKQCQWLYVHWPPDCGSC